MSHGGIPFVCFQSCLRASIQKQVGSVTEVHKEVQRLGLGVVISGV